MLNLEIEGNEFCIMCDDPEASLLLRESLTEHVRDTAFPLGFVLRRPTAQRRFFVVTDRSGTVLGRTRQFRQAVAVLSGHLSAFLPAPSGTIRLKLRALVSQQSLVIGCASPLLSIPPIIERRLHTTGYSVLDRLVVDIDPGSGEVTHSAVPWPALRGLDPGDGHVGPSDQPMLINSLWLQSAPSLGSMSPAAAVSSLSAVFSSDLDRETILDHCDLLLSRVALVEVTTADPGAVYRHLQMNHDQGLQQEPSRSVMSIVARKK